MPFPKLTCSLVSAAAFAALPITAFSHSQAEHFSSNVFTKAPEIVDCELEDGSEASCYELTVGYLPESITPGPFCPATLDDKGGLWYWDGDDEGLYRLNREFWMLLDSLGYKFFNDDGSVNIVDNASSPPEAEHACINVAPDENVTVTMRIPIHPVMSPEPIYLDTVAKVGVALDGAPIFADAPSVQDRGHLPALDICGGHIDPGGWYHWHAIASDIQVALDDADVQALCGQPQDSSALFGYAFDGYAIYGTQEPDGSTPEDLDECNGHYGPTPESKDEEYHYHASANFPNLPPCLFGVQAKGNFATTSDFGIGAARDPGGPGSPNGGRPPRPEPKD